MSKDILTGGIPEWHGKWNGEYIKWKKEILEREEKEKERYIQENNLPCYKCKYRKESKRDYWIDSKVVFFCEVYKKEFYGSKIICKHFNMTFEAKMKDILNEK